MYIAAQLYFPFLIHITFNSPSPTLLHFNNMLEITFNFFFIISFHSHSTKLIYLKLFFPLLYIANFPSDRENFKDRYIFMLNDIKYCLQYIQNLSHSMPVFIFVYVYYILEASIQPNSSAEKNIYALGYKTMVSDRFSFIYIC